MLLIIFKNYLTSEIIPKFYLIFNQNSKDLKFFFSILFLKFSNFFPEFSIFLFSCFWRNMRLSDSPLTRVFNEVGFCVETLICFEENF